MDDDMFAPIVAAFTDVRSRLEPRAQTLAQRIYDGDRAALDEAEQIMRRSGEMIDQLQRVTGESTVDTELDICIIQKLLGIYEMADAVLVAFGEQPCDDPAVWERWRPLRLERRRSQLEQWVDQIDEMETAGTLTGEAATWRNEARGMLALIAAGIEPDDEYV
jgi:cytochrome P450